MTDRRGGSPWRGGALAGACAAVSAAGGTSVSLSSAATTRDDVPESQYIALGAQSQYAASGYIDVLPNGSSPEFASATLIAPDWVLTVAHAVTVGGMGPAFPASDVSFGQGATAVTFQQASNAALQVIVDPAFTGNSVMGNDLALIQLSTPITSIAPAALYSGALGSELNQTATIIGYGYTGTGLTGYSGATLGTRLGITNVIDALGNQTTLGGPGGTTTYSYGFSPNVMLTDFDNPKNPSAGVMGATSPTSLEGASVAGDSGGGLFLTVGGQTYLAGVTAFVGVFPDNALSSSANGYYGDYNGYTRVGTSSTLAFIDSTLASTSTWNATGGGTWNSLSNWGGTNIPEFAQATASFAGGTKSASTITLDASWTVGSLAFKNTNSYTLAAGSGGSLTLDNGGPAATASVNDSLGNDAISAPLNLSSTVLVTVAGATNTLTISGNLRGAGGFTTAGAGTVVLSGSNSYAGPTSVTSGKLTIAAPVALPTHAVLTVGTSSSAGKAQFALAGATISLAALTINSGSSVDIGNNTLAINFASPAVDPISAIQNYLLTGYANGGVGAWSGAGLISSAAAVNANRYALGYADGNVDPGSIAQANQIIVKYTLLGDATLDGNVGFSDLLVVSQHYGGTGDDWEEGNFTYNPQGVVGFSDLLMVSQNFGQSLLVGQSADDLTDTLALAWSAVAVPEPSAAALLFVGMAGLVGRRRRRRM